MDCKYKNRLNDYNFCLVACAYCTLEQEITCKRKITINDNAPTVDIKTEVAREIFAEIERLLDKYSTAQCFQGDVFVQSYFEYELEDAITELKNKYIGGAGE